MKAKKKKLDNLSDGILKEIEKLEENENLEETKKLYKQVKKLKEKSVYDLYNIVKLSEDRNSTLFKISIPN